MYMGMQVTLLPLVGAGDDGDSIDETLVSEGLAKAWTRDGQHRDLLVGMAQARQSGVGCLGNQIPTDGAPAGM